MKRNEIEFIRDLGIKIDENETIGVNDTRTEQDVDSGCQGITESNHVEKDPE